MSDITAGEVNVLPRDRALALEVRAGKIGFAAFEGPELIDCGTHRYARHGDGARSTVAKFAALLDFVTPAVVVTRRPRRSAHESSNRARSRWRTLASALQRRAIPLIVVPRKRAKSCFAERGCRSKSDIATWLVARFPSLAWRLPPKRKTWQREAHAVVIFDAVATAVASGLIPTRP